jgi:hypothetical protein
VRRLVSEHGAIDALLSFAGSLVDAIVNELAPHPHGVSGKGTEYPLLAGADELLPSSPIGVLAAAVMPQVHFEAVKVAILGQPPMRLLHCSQFQPW